MPAQGLMRRAVFLDRDGVLTRARVHEGKPYAPLRLDDFQLLPGTVEAVAALRAAGFVIIVATNQPDIAQGLVDPDVVNAMHDRLREWIPVHAVEVCPHSERQECECRKPKPGLLMSAARRLDIDLAASVMVGDRWKDVEAGRRAGCRTVFIDRGYTEPKPVEPDVVVDSLPDAVDWILGSGTGPQHE